MIRLFGLGLIILGALLLAFPWLALRLVAWSRIDGLRLAPRWQFAVVGGAAIASGVRLLIR